MTRNLKALGLALVAVFAMSAVAVSTAAAEVPGHFVADSAPAFLTAEATSKQVYTAGGNQLTCNNVAVHTDEVSETQTNITVTPTYSGSDTYGSGPNAPCEGAVGGSTVKIFVDFTKCDYNFTATTDSEEHAQVHIECENPETEGIHIKATGLKLPCYTITPQTVGGKNNESGVHYTNNEGHVDINATVNDISYHSEGVCGSETGTASYKGEVTVSAHDENEKAVGIEYTTTE